jgi:demethylmenaquinone methyltransferase/2-methoxy-6-polyprenyl-1,4-benzoquinol methylase
LRIEVINMLKLQAGETVLDIACGTGSTLPLLAAAVGSAGRVVGVELSVEMAAQAAKRVAHLPQASIVQTSMINYSPIYKADALLMCYAQDVLQCSKTVDQLIAASKPGARIALVGMQTLPWLWGWPVNLFNLYRARRYLTTYANMDKPWRLLEERGAQLRLVRTALWGSAYLVVGNLPN